MNVTKHSDNQQTTLTLSGRLDTTTSPDFQKMLLTEIEAGCTVVLDCTDLSYVSSAGLRVLLIGQKTVTASGQTMTLRHVPETVMEVLDMTGFSDILTIESN